MSENFYEEAWKYSLDEIHNQYISEDKEREFLFNFNINYVEDSDNKIIASVPSAFMKNQIISKGILTTIQNKIREVTGQNDIVLECIIKSETSSNPSNIKPVTEEKSDKTAEEIFKEPDYDSINFSSKNSSESEEKDSDSRLNEYPYSKNFTFDTFVSGDNNDYPYKAAIAVAENPGKKYNPVLFYGNSGLGKTHLMKAIGNYIYQHSDEKTKILYVTAEQFGSEFIKSLATNTAKVNEFKNKYRNLDVLLVDDIHFLQSKPSMQEELFYTFEALSLKNAQMVFTCDKPLRDIKDMTDRLVSRLSNGLNINLNAPNYETRYAILQKKIEFQGKYLDPEIIDYIAKNVETNVRALEAALSKVLGYAEIIGKNPTLEIVKNQLTDILPSSDENITIDTIQRVIANDYQISVSNLKSPKRDKKFVIPRQIAIYLSREMTEQSLTEIGKEFGGKDHTTIMHAIDKIEDLQKTDPSLESKINIFKKEIRDFKKPKN